MISEIGLINFKCFGRQKIRLAPLTLLTGLNGMGKSSVIQSLLVIRQSYDDGLLGEGRLATAGSLVDLGSPQDVLYENAKSENIAITLKSFEDNRRLVLRMSVSGEGNSVRADKYEVRNIDAFASVISSEIFGRFLDMTVHERSRSLIAEFQYLQAERNGPRKYLPTKPDHKGKFSLGANGQYVLHFLSVFGQALNIAESDPRWMEADGNRLIDQVTAWLDKISPGVNLSVETVSEADLVVGGFSFGEEGSLRSRPFRATNVGFGISYVLPVLVALLAAPSGGIVILENPEAHLHPAGQAKLGELCARAAAAGVQVIIESHSDHLMDGLRIAVREDILSSEDLLFHYFRREAGVARVITPDVSSDGKLSEWPEGFFDQHRKNAVRLLAPKG